MKQIFPFIFYFIRDLNPHSSLTLSLRLSLRSSFHTPPIPSLSTHTYIPPCAPARVFDSIEAVRHLPARELKPMRSARLKPKAEGVIELRSGLYKTLVLPYARPRAYRLYKTFGFTLKD